MKCISITLGLVLVWGCSSDEPIADPPEPVVAITETQPVGRSQDVPIPEIATRPLDVHTSEAGFAVFVNAYPARTVTGDLLLTPCRVRIPGDAAASIRITVAKAGVEDASQDVQGSEQSEMIFTEPKPTLEFTNSLLSAPLLQTEVGRPVALLSLNSPGPELDPYVEPAGLLMLFVGDREEGRAIYLAERKSPFDFFEPPTILRATQSRELPATPSLTENAELVYAIPEKSRIQSASALNELDRPESLRFGTRSQQLWETAQILPDGLHLYWTERSEGSQDRRSFTSYRKSPRDSFKYAKEFNLPGQLPCLSADGLRQYVFDGRILKRARRTSLQEHFAAPEILANVDLPNYRYDPNRRLFWVSENEEWLYYSANGGQGDLYAVRLFLGPGWGYAPLGEKIAPRLMVAETKPIDPGSLPFIPPEVEAKRLREPAPYPKFREEFIKLLKDRQYEKADLALTAAAKDAKFKAEGTVLEWDREEYWLVTNFWRLARESIRSMPVDTVFKIRNAKVKFVKLEEDVIHFRATKAGTKPLGEMQVRDLLAIIEPRLSDDDAEGRMRVAMFLHYDAEGDRKLADEFLDKAGKRGETFRGRLAGRMLHNAQRELDDGRLAEGLAYLDALLESHPDAMAADLAKTLQAEIYQKIAWKPIGPRAWEKPEAGTFLADKTRQAGSYLVSPKTYTHFELRSEWKIIEPGGSGGVFFRYAAPGKEDPYRKAFKLQLADDKNFKPDPQSTGALHTYEAPSENASKARGEWNTLRLRVRNLNVEVWINGKQVLDTIAQNDMVPLAGFVALDGVTGGIAYRKTLLVELPPNVE